ncbi:hypothetical protein GCM10020001_102000 [Nonomuraea salmonea]
MSRATPAMTEMKPWSPVPWTVGGEAQAHRADAAFGVPQGEVLGAAARRVGAVEGRGDVLGEHPVGEAGDAGGEQERPVAAFEGVAEGLDGGALGGVGAGQVAPVVLVGQVDDGLGRLGAGAQAVEVVEVAAVDVGALGLQRGGGGVGPGQAGDLVPGGEQVVDDGRADPAGGSGDENVHGCTPRKVMSATDVSD